MENIKNNSLYNLIDVTKLPKHIGIIMDGNGRWAQRRGLPRSMGHYNGVKRVVDTVRNCSNLGIETLSLYAFSTENWKRPVEEIEKIMFLLIKFINENIEELARENVYLNILGDTSVMPKRVKSSLDHALDRTKDNTGMTLNIALNYGGRSEIIHALKNVIMDYKDKSEDEISYIDEEVFERYLYTYPNSDVDLLIRPSGELRLSNFLLYQVAYSEFYFSDVMWPDFDLNELLKAIIDYQERDRRFGGLNE